MNKQHYAYGLIFWNPKTDHEICTYFFASDYFDAEDIAKNHSLDGYNKGVITFIDDLSSSYFDTPLEGLTKIK